ncbi:MAG: APC family permease [Acutalibacteraceae bacterium]
MSAQTPTKKDYGSSTKDLNRVLGVKELMGIAIGQIIGAGIMSMMGIAINYTGRSANLAFMLSAVFTMCTFFPSIFISSCIRMRGGLYTQFGIFVGERWSGYYGIIYIVTKMTLAMYSLSFAQYFIALVPGAPEKAVALGVATFFIGLAFFGVDLAAKVQNLLVIALIAALVVFAVFGFPYVDLGNYFSNADGMFLSDGIGGFLTAVAYLGFATGGATVILDSSAECKNPTKDIPFVIVVSTCGVALLYGLVATVASGVLPVSEVANQPLTLVANIVLPGPVYIFFIVCGAMFALATTLNSQMLSAPKPLMQICEDGWLPKSFAQLSKYKTPYKILIALYFVAIIPILLDLEISQISSMVQILGYVNNFILATAACKLPDMFPNSGPSRTSAFPLAF